MKSFLDENISRSFLDESVFYQPTADRQRQSRQPTDRDRADSRQTETDQPTDRPDRADRQRQSRQTETEPTGQRQTERQTETDRGGERERGEREREGASLSLALSCFLLKFVCAHSSVLFVNGATMVVLLRRRMKPIRMSRCNSWNWRGWNCANCGWEWQTGQARDAAGTRHGRGPRHGDASQLPVPDGDDENRNLDNSNTNSSSNRSEAGLSPCETSTSSP